jgi:hypothetical protein
MTVGESAVENHSRLTCALRGQGSCLRCMGDAMNEQEAGSAVLVSLDIEGKPALLLAAMNTVWEMHIECGPGSRERTYFPLRGHCEGIRILRDLLAKRDPATISAVLCAHAMREKFYSVFLGYDFVHGRPEVCLQFK